MRSLYFESTTSMKPLAMVSPPELNHWDPVVKYKFSMSGTSNILASTTSMISLDSFAEKFPLALIEISATTGSTSAKYRVPLLKLPYIAKPKNHNSITTAMSVSPGFLTNFFRAFPYTLEILSNITSPVCSLSPDTNVDFL